MSKPDIPALLQQIFDADTGIYQDRGFQRRVGFGARPALIHIDLANAWTRPGNPFSCDGMETIIPAVQQLNHVGRAKGVPVVYTSTAYDDVEGPELRHGALGSQDPDRGPEGGVRGCCDRRSDRSPGRRDGDREEAREWLPRDEPVELSERARRRHRHRHRGDDGGVRATHGRGRDRRGLPANRCPRGPSVTACLASSSETSSTSIRSSATSSRSRTCSCTSRASSRSRAASAARRRRRSAAAGAAAPASAGL